MAEVITKFLFTTLFCLLLALSLFVKSVSAFDMSSGYTLPYPPQMPGSIMYKVRLLEEKIQSFWNFGNYASFQFNLTMSDRYLVQTKTLLEYKQYLLAREALQTSDTYFKRIMPPVVQAAKEGRDVSDEKNLLVAASRKHIEVLEYLKDDTPMTVEWVPEKTKSTTINFNDLITKSINMRKTTL